MAGSEVRLPRLTAGASEGLALALQGFAFLAALIAAIAFLLKGTFGGFGRRGNRIGSPGPGTRAAAAARAANIAAFASLLIGGDAAGFNFFAISTPVFLELQKLIRGV